MRGAVIVATALFAAAAVSQARVSPRADLSVRVAIEGSAVGDAVEALVTVRNRGPKVARRVVLIVRLPFEVESIGSSGPLRFRCGSISFTPGPVRCTLRRIPPRRSVSVRFLGPQLLEPTSPAVTATVRSATRDPVRRNNSVTMTVDVAG